MNKILSISIVLVLVVTIQGCYYDIEEELYPASTNTCDTLNVTYIATVKPIIDANCNNCHSQAIGQGGVVLETYANVKDYAIAGSLLGAIRHETGFAAMPQGAAKLGDCNILKIEKWVANQYPEN